MTVDSMSGMCFFEHFGDYVIRDMEAAKESGVKIAGIYCIFAPVELIYAAGALPVGLCGKKQESIDVAETILPTTLCPLIKSSFGYAVSNTCPFFEASDFIIGETTCDGKKKMFELMGQIKTLHLMHLPYTLHQQDALDYWYAQIHHLKTFLEEQTGNTIHPDDLACQIKWQNQIRLHFQKLMELNRLGNGRSPIKGMDLLPLMESKGFVMDIPGYLKQLDKVMNELQARQEKEHKDAKAAKRILLTGTPLGKGSEKVLRLIEEVGGVVVCMENCTGIKGIYTLVDETCADPFLAIAKRYLETPCACMTPNERRIELVSSLIEDYGIQGVVDLSWQCCTTYQVESVSLKKTVEERFDIPFINISTDYSTADMGQLRVRIEAFIELITG